MQDRWPIRHRQTKQPKVKSRPIERGFTKGRGLANQRGQGLIEYLILVSIIAVGSISLVSLISQNLRSRLASVTAALAGKERSYRTESLDRSHLSYKTLGNFMNGVDGGNP